MASSSNVQFCSEEDLALLNDDNAIRVQVNGTVKYLARDWLENGGRAADSVLAKQVLGTEQGLAGSDAITIDDELEAAFDLVVVWLAMGNERLEMLLTEENASMLFELAEYFDLKDLQKAIRDEEGRREKEDEEKRQKQLEARLRLQRTAERQGKLEAQRRRGDVPCFSCGTMTSVAPTYMGNRPRCWSCRNGEEYDHLFDSFYDEGYDHCDSDDSW